MGMKRSVLVSLILMGVSQLQLRAAGRRPGTATSAWPPRSGSRISPAASAASCVVAYFSALCDLRFTAAQYALISAAASIVGRVLTGTTAGALIDALGYVNFYLLTTVAALPGILLFWWMIRTGLIDSSIGTAGVEGEGDAPRAQSGMVPFAASASPAR